MTPAFPAVGPAVSSSREAAAGPDMEPPAAAIAELVLRSRAGCRDSFAALVAHFEKRVFYYLYQMTRNPHDAEDLTQVTFLKAFQNIHRFEPQRAFHAWLFTIAKRTALNHFRDSHPAEELSPDLEAVTPHPTVAMERDETCARVWKKARALKPDQYEALWLRYGEGFSIAETAQIMKTNGLRVRVLLHRARAALARSLGQRYET